MKEPIMSTCASTPRVFSAQIRGIRVHQRPIVHTDGPRINADAADLRGTAVPESKEVSLQRNEK